MVFISTYSGSRSCTGAGSQGEAEGAPPQYGELERRRMEDLLSQEPAGFTLMFAVLEFVVRLPAPI